ncbi:proton-conducting transporter membrane subunit [Tepidiforma sp.]|uniref:proton-conducting transporter transmembrane domain-containing protein n=1 Tax=Tepidiforma sp. TaxID=2682230 RepID=UPI002ADE5193|nr:proton-conducting transporter membrane subunit [Tepidiforma sp.]
MSLLVGLPLAVPLVAAIAGLLTLRWPRWQAPIAIGGAAVLLGCAVALLGWSWREGIQVLEVGGWPAPFGIVLVADMLSTVLVTAAGVVGLGAAVYSAGNVDEARVRAGYYPLMHVLLLGVCGAFLSGDIFNLYVWFEVMLMASFVLMVIGGERPQFEAGMKYVVLNLMGSVAFLSGVGLLYGAMGTLNMAQLAVEVAEAGEGARYLTVVAMLFLVAFGLKAAVFPLYSWLPASYHTAPAPVAALFAGLLTKVGVYALLRVFTLVFTQDAGYTRELLWWISAATMVSGVLGAAAHQDMKRILSFHIVSQIGYMTMGLAIASPLALGGALFYLVHNIVAKTNLFFVAGVVRRLRGSYELESLGGLGRAHPWLAVAFFVSAFSLAGVPPLSGFFAKFIMVRAAVEEREYAAAAVMLGVGLLTLFSMVKIWTEAFLKPSPGGAVGEGSVGAAAWLPVGAFAVLAVAMGVGAEWWWRPMELAGQQLFDRNGYIEAVLGGAR